MPLSILFKNDESIPFEYKSFKEDSPFQRLYHSYLNDQEVRYSVFRTDSFVKVTLDEKDLSANDVKLSFEINEYKRYLIIEIDNRFISQKIPIAKDLNIYQAKAQCKKGVLEINIPIE